MFEIYQSPKKKEYHFRLKAKNGQVILSSQGYKTKQACQAGVRSVTKNSARGDRFQVEEARNGKLYFNLSAANGEVIGTSQMYATAAGRTKGMASVQRNAADAVVKDLT